MFSIAIPYDVLDEAPDEASKVRKLGYIARAAAIFKVDKIVIYVYGNGDWEKAEYIKLLLEYAVTPPYLRKKLFKLDDRLKYAGLLPPLKIPSHTVDKEPSVGEIREGVVERWDGYSSLVYIGANKYAKVPKPYPIGTKLLVRIEAPTPRADTYRASVYRGKPPVYWGYDVEIRRAKALFQGFDAVILTGKEGRSVCKTELKLGERNLVVFGSPKRGVDEILRNEGVGEIRLINFIPSQGVETVRTEEAVFIVLAILNYFINCK